MSKHRIILFFLLPVICFGDLFAQTIIPLYPNAIPNAISTSIQEDSITERGVFIGYGKVSLPTLQIYLPGKSKEPTAAVIICPGGGYIKETYVAEGVKIAEEFTRNNVAAIILKYRLPSDLTMKVKSEGPLQDAQQAIKIVRQNATQWNIDLNEIGIMGFSAGGHLAASAGTHFDTSLIDNKEKINLRPDFMVLVYPIISMTNDLTHKPSKELLLGVNPSKRDVDFFSNELQVTDRTPPCWIIHSGADNVVPVENSIAFYEALHKHHVEAEMHLFPKGDHGFVLNMPAGEWMDSLFEWMKKSGWLNLNKN
jgi:acetyl esterase/lipase